MTDDEPTLWLESESLLSRWGFNDGDAPDEYLDWLDTDGHPYPRNWHAVLRALIRTHLLPALDQRVEVFDIETIHNPIRAETVNGADVTDLRHGGSLLTPEGVSVPFDEVLRVMREIEGTEMRETPNA